MIARRPSLLVSNFADVRRALSIDLRHLPLSQPVQVEVLAVDATHELTSINKTKMNGNAPALTLDLPGNAVYLVQLTDNSGK